MKGMILILSVLVMAIVVIIVVHKYSCDSFTRQYDRLSSVYRDDDISLSYAYPKDDLSIVRQCTGGPYMTSSNRLLTDVCSTVPIDTIDQVDCGRINRVVYQSPAFSSCGNYSSQQYGTPALRYPMLLIN